MYYYQKILYIINWVALKLAQSKVWISFLSVMLINFIALIRLDDLLNLFYYYHEYSTLIISSRLKDFLFTYNLIKKFDMDYNFLIPLNIAFSHSAPFALSLPWLFIPHYNFYLSHYSRVIANLEVLQVTYALESAAI